jgi:hypothetical protein
MYHGMSSSNSSSRLVFAGAAGSMLLGGRCSYPYGSCDNGWLHLYQPHEKKLGAMVPLLHFPATWD